MSRALTNLLRHDHHAEVMAHGFMDTAGWVSVKDIATVPSIRAWALEETDIRNIVLKQGKKERLEFDCWEDKIRCIQGHGRTVGSNVHFEEIFTEVSFDKNYTDMLYHGTLVEYVPSIVTEGIDRRFSKCGTRCHLHFTDQIEAVKKGHQVPGVRDGSTAVVSMPLGGLLEAGVKVWRTSNGCYVTEGIDGRLPARFISSVLRLDDLTRLWPTEDAAVNLAVQRDQVDRMYGDTDKIEEE